MYAFMVLLNVQLLALLAWLASGPRAVLEELGMEEFTLVTQWAAGALILLIPGLVIVRQVQRAAIRGTAVQLSRTQFPDIHAWVAEISERLGMRRTPGVYLANGNGTLNAFAAQSGLDNSYTVISNELFANLDNNNREGLRFILGHECAHIRLGHVALWYQLSICFSQYLPLLGPTLSRLREYSCDRNGAAMEPAGERGLVLLTAGRYAHDHVTIPELVDQGRTLGGFWVEVAQLNMSHPWTVRRLWRLYQLGLFSGTGRAPKQRGARR
jgi:Zn-dependent protease with chaperone function